MNKSTNSLSRREREIMDILLELRQGSAREVTERLTDNPSNSTVRALLARMEKKGLIKHIEENLRYVFVPVISREKARESAFSRIAKIFYSGSMANAVTGMVNQSGDELTDKELDEIEKAIQDARSRRDRSKRDKSGRDQSGREE